MAYVTCLFDSIVRTSGVGFTDMSKCLVTTECSVGSRKALYSVPQISSYTEASLVRGTTASTTSLRTYNLQQAYENKSGLFPNYKPITFTVTVLDGHQ